MAAAQKETAKEVTVNDLIQLVLANTATAQQKKQLSEMLEAQAQKEEEDTFNQRVNEVMAFIKEKGLTLQDLVKANKPTATAYFGPWVDKEGKEHYRYDGEKGPFPKWVGDMKEELTKTKALEIAGNNEKAKAFIEKVYK